MAEQETPTRCRNDGTELTGDYCHTCGQSADEPRRAVMGLVQDFFVDTLAIDGKLFRTVGLLLWKPGALARRYLDGKRVRYSPPFRLYLFTTVFFFFAVFAQFQLPAPGAEEASADIAKSLGDLSEEEAAEARKELDEASEALREAGSDGLADFLQGVSDGLEDGEIDAAEPAPQDEPSETEEASSEEDDGLNGRITVGDKGFPLEKESSDSVVAAIEADEDTPQWLKDVAPRFADAAERLGDDPRLFVAQAKENLPRMLLLAPIVYAVILMFLYVYRRKYYAYDHFVVSLYMHAALYAYLLLAILLNKLPFVGWLAVVPIGWGMLQPYLVFRQAYGSNWFSVIAKGVISNTIYVVSYAVLITLGLSYALYQS